MKLKFKQQAYQTQSWTTKSSEGSDKNLISVAFVEVGWAGSGWR